MVMKKFTSNQEKQKTSKPQSLKYKKRNNMPNCPKCGSNNVSELHLVMSYKRNYYKCKDCGFEW